MRANLIWNFFWFVLETAIGSAVCQGFKAFHATAYLHQTLQKDIFLQVWIDSLQVSYLFFWGINHQEPVKKTCLPTVKQFSNIYRLLKLLLKSDLLSTEELHRVYTAVISFLLKGAAAPFLLKGALFYIAIISPWECINRITPLAPKDWKVF